MERHRRVSYNAGLLVTVPHFRRGVGRVLNTSRRPSSNVVVGMSVSGAHSATLEESPRPHGKAMSDGMVSLRPQHSQARATCSRVATPITGLQRVGSGVKRLAQEEMDKFLEALRMGWRRAMDTIEFGKCCMEME